MRYAQMKFVLLMLAAVAVAWAHPVPASAESALDLDYEAKGALRDLYGSTPSAKRLGERAKAILVFPNIVKGGFLVAGQYGEGVLLKDGKTAGYYSTIQVSYGMQAGLEKYGYAMFFMNESALEWLDRSDGWELGAGPSIVVVDDAKEREFTTTTLLSDAYAFFFNPEGLMGGMGLQGTKITRIRK